MTRREDDLLRATTHDVASRVFPLVGSNLSADRRASRATARLVGALSLDTALLLASIGASNMGILTGKVVLFESVLGGILTGAAIVDRVRAGLDVRRSNKTLGLKI